MAFKKGQIVSAGGVVCRLQRIHDGDGWKASLVDGSEITLAGRVLAPATPGEVEEFIEALRKRKAAQ